MPARVPRDCFERPYQVGSYSIYLFLSDLFTINTIRSTHVANGRLPSFSWLNIIRVCVCSACVYDNNFLIHSFINGHLGFSYVLVIVNNASVKMEVQITFQTNDFISFRYILRRGMDHMVVSFLIF